MNTLQDRLQALLMELFQLDEPELDFGLHRLLRGRREELGAFLRRDLLPQVGAALADEPSGVAEREVFEHIYAFFRRYYAEGDFLARRIYRPGVYAVPYEGQETTLYWANADQYYIKSSELLRDYAFMLDSGGQMRRVCLRVVDAAEGEHGNVRADKGRDRAFIWDSVEAPAAEARELVLRFRFCVPSLADWPADKARKAPPSQRELIAIAVAGVLASTSSSWSAPLARPHVLADGTPSRACCLEAHLLRFTARQTFDYFIHKDLAAFLERELDFYIKNEVVDLDDIERQSPTKRDRALNKIAGLRGVARKIIAFLAQGEELQKRLWLKKKLVVESHVCVTLDRVPPSLYPEVAANPMQREAWVRLFAIDQVAQFTKPLSVAFLAAHPHLPLDTTYFDDRFEARLLDGMGDLDARWSGLLMQGDNFQAARLLARRYESSVKCAYLDPPYNTSEETFVYKNNYRHSSWLSMMRDRVEALVGLLRQDAILMVTIDDEEAYRLKLLLDEVLGADSYVGTVVVQSNPRGRGTNSFFATSHEYCLCYAKDPGRARIVDQPLSDDQARVYRHADSTSRFRWLPFRRSGGLSTPAERPNSEFAIYCARNEGRVVAVGGKRTRPYPAPYESDEVLVLTHDGAVDSVSGASFRQGDAQDIVAVLPVDAEGGRRVWRWADRAKVLAAAHAGDLVMQETVGSLSLMLKDRAKPGRKPKTVWSDARCDASTHGTNVLKQMLGERGSFGYPKSIHATRDAIHAVVGDDRDAVVMDLFGGSGTTAHAVLELNRQDGGQRQFVLVEAESYFDTVLGPRVLKAAYCPRWRGGKPLAHDQGMSLALKVIRLESYEDTLNNLVLARSAEQQRVLDDPACGGADGFKEQYVLERMLEVETRGSAPMLGQAWLRDPTACRLEVRRPGSGARHTVNVDLVETFNLLLGLRVSRVFAPQSFSAAFERGEDGCLRVAGQLAPDDTGSWWFRMVTGTAPDGSKVLVIWRKLTSDAERDDAVLNTWFALWGEARAGRLDAVYINGDNHLRAGAGAEAWRSSLIEEELAKLLFEEDRA